MVIGRKNLSLFLAVLLFVLFYYSPLFEKKSNSGVFCLKEFKNINQISGKINSSPIKLSNSQYYTTTLQTSHVTQNQEKFSCNGKIKVMIPTKMVEAHFPGKLYSSSKSKVNTIYESGGNYTFLGKFSKNTFYVTDCIEVNWANTLNGKLSHFRAKSRLLFKRLMFYWGDAGGLLLALLTGSREYTENNISNAFSKAGLSHILALSGMHLSLFSSLAMFIGKKAKRKKIEFIIRIFSLIFFVWFAGFSPSLLRAFLCTSLIIFSSLIDDKKPDMIFILSLSFVLQVLISPADLSSIAFILSYAALLGIILFNKIFKILFIKFLPNYLSSSLASSTSAQLFTAPITLLKWGTYSPIGIIATCFVSPCITFFIYTGLLCIILSLIFPFMSEFSAFFMKNIYNVIKYMVVSFSKVGGFEIR